MSSSKRKKSVPRSNGDAVDAVYDRKIPPRFFFFKKESSRHKNTIIYLHRILILFWKRKMNSFTFWHLLGSKASFIADYIFFFSYVSLAFWFYVLFEEAIEMDIWYVHKYIILKLIFFWDRLLKHFLCFQIKLCGICCLASAVLCVVITVTTTVIHMNRLQTLRECVYQGSIQTCTCFAGFFDPTMTHHDGNNKSISNIICNQKKFPKFFLAPLKIYMTQHQYSVRVGGYQKYLVI